MDRSSILLLYFLGLLAIFFAHHYLYWAFINRKYQKKLRKSFDREFYISIGKKKDRQSLWVMNAINICFFIPTILLCIFEFSPISTEDIFLLLYFIVPTTIGFANHLLYKENMIKKIQWRIQKNDKT